MIVLNGIKFGLVLALLVGPVFFSIIQTSVEKGFWNGVLVAVGISLSDIFYVTICFLGMAQFLENESFRIFLAYAGGCILILFGSYHLFVKSRRRLHREVEESSQSGIIRYIAKGFVINGFSPMVPIFWIGVVSIASLDLNYNKESDFLLFMSSLLLTVFFTDITKAYLADKLRTLITNRFLRIMNIALGALLVIFGGRLLMLAQNINELVL